MWQPLQLFNNVDCFANEISEQMLAEIPYDTLMEVLSEVLGSVIVAVFL